MLAFPILLGLYLAALLAIGVRARRRSASGSGYFVADRKLGPFLSTAALSGTVVSGSATIVAAELVFRRGLPGLWLDLWGGAGLLLLGAFLARRVRRSRSITLPAIAGEAFGEKCRLAAAILVLLSQISFLALLVRGTAVVVAPESGLDPSLVCGIVTGVVILSTLLGGQLAVALTDVVHLVLMAAAVFGIIVPFVLARGGDLGALPSHSLDFPLAPGFGFGDLLGLALMYGLPHVVGADVYSKLLSSRDERTARVAAIASGFVKIAFGAAMALVGLSARALPEGAVPSPVLPSMIQLCVPEPLRSLAIVGMIAVLMSTANTVLLTASTVLSCDLLPRLGEGKAVRSARLGGLSIGGLALLLALLQSDSLLAPFRLSYTMYAAGLSLPVLATFLPPRLRPPGQAVLAAVVLGGLGAAVLHLSVRDWESPTPVLGGALLSGAALLAGIAANRARASRRAPAALR